MDQAPLSPVSSQIEPSHEAPTTLPFEPYTFFPKAEAFLETHLGQHCKVVLLPEDWRDRYVRIAPWLALAFLPFKIMGLFAAIGLSALSLLLGIVSGLSILFILASFTCDLVALPGLFKRARWGWSFALYSSTLTMVDCVLNQSLFALLVGVLVLFLMFQVKYRYR